MFLIYYNSFLIVCAVTPDRGRFVNKLNLWLFITSPSWNFSANELVPQFSLLGLGFLCTFIQTHNLCAWKKEKKDREMELCVWSFLSISNLRAYLTFCSQCSRHTGKTQLKGIKNEKPLQLLHPSFRGTKVSGFVCYPCPSFSSVSRCLSRQDTWNEADVRTSDNQHIKLILFP